MFEQSKQASATARWIIATVVAGACLVGSARGVAVASATPIVEVRVAPPAPRVEVVPARPSPHHVWVRGYWAWNGHAHYWVRGRYIMERRGYEYREPHWEPAARGHYRFHDGGYYRR